MTDTIELRLPFKAEYVSILRLTASGIANRVGFDIDTIEDIKVAVAEVCNKVIQTGSGSSHQLEVIFEIKADALSVAFKSEDESLRCIFEGSSGELGLSIINALMDEVKLCDDRGYILSLTKYLEGKNQNE